MIFAVSNAIALAATCSVAGPGDTAVCRSQCEADDALACHHLGFLLETGIGLVPPQDEISWHGELDEMFGPVPRPPQVQDLAGAEVAYGRACELGSPDGCLAVGVLQRRDGPDQDLASARAYFARAFAGWTQGCEAGDGRRCQLMAAAWWGNWDHPEDQAEAYRWSARACALDDGRGCWAQAGAHLAGRGTHRDIDLAEGLFLKSCDQLDSIVGCLALKTFYGPAGTRPTPRRAARYEARCCKLDPDLCRRSGPLGDR